MKPKKKMSSIMVVFICIMVTLYAAADFILQYYTSIEVSPTLTTAWFAFWGVELVNLAFITTTKVKHTQDQTNQTTENNEINNEEIKG